MKIKLNITDELRKLSDEGYGLVVSKDQMKEDKVLPVNQCATVYMKPHIMHVDKGFLSMGSDCDVSEDTYCRNFDKAVDDTTKIMVKKYHPHRDSIWYTQMPGNATGNY